MSKHGRFEQEKPKTSKKKLALILGVGVAVVLLIALFAGGKLLLGRIVRPVPEEKPVTQEDIDAIMNYNPDAPTSGTEATLPTLETTEATEETTEETTVPPTTAYVPSAEDVLNIMVVGQAARDGEEYRMADTMILVSINKHDKTMTLTSFLRDTYLKLPNYKDLSGRQHTCGNQRLNVCYHLGYTFGGTADAMLMLNQCVKENFGIEVDYNVEVDFMGVELITNYLGGIEIDLTQAEADYLNADDNYVLYDVQAGPTLLDGMATLSYARMRKAEGDNDSDITRTSRQRVVLEKLFEKVRNSDVAGLTRLAYDFLPMVTTNMTDADIVKCAAEIFPILPELTITTGTCPVQSTYWGEIVDIGGYPSSVLKFDEGQNKKLMMAITENAK